MSSDIADSTAGLGANVPQGLNLQDNATLLQALYVNDTAQKMAMRRQAMAKWQGLPDMPQGTGGITVSHNHIYQPPAVAQPTDQPSIASRLAGPALLGLAGITGALGGAGLLAAYRPNAPAPIITPTSTSTTTTTNTQSPALLPPAAKNPNYKIGVE